MSLPIPLAVRLVTSRADRYVTADLRDLTFRETAVGGWGSIRISLDRPLTIQPNEIAHYGRCYVYDTRSGRVISEGRLEDPGRGAGAGGQVWDLVAMGPAAHARDRTVPITYVDTSLRELVRADNYTPGGTDRVGGDPGAPTGNQEALTLQFPSGLPVNIDAKVCMRYTRLMESGQQLARVDYTWDSGTADTTFQSQMVTRTDGSTASGDIVRSENLVTTGGATSPRVIITSFPVGRNTVEWRLFRSGAAATIPSDLFWLSIRNVVVIATRYNKGGTELLTAADYTANTVLASEVVADLLGRLLVQYDGAGASIATTTYAIDQMSYPDGTTAGKILDDLMVIEPGYRWGAYESNSAGRHRFEWAPWPTAVRYEADVTDGFDSPGSADGVYNAVRVRWRGPDGQILSTRRTSTVPALVAAGITREAQVDLGDELGSRTNAQQTGDKFLAEHATAPNAGRLTIARPITDLYTGARVQPFEIKAGELIRVRGVLPRLDSLNATARDGTTVFRVWSKEFTARTASATLELDSYSVTTARALADLRARPDTRRR